MHQHYQILLSDDNFPDEPFFEFEYIGKRLGAAIAHRAGILAC